MAKILTNVHKFHAYMYVCDCFGMYYILGNVSKVKQENEQGSKEGFDLSRCPFRDNVSPRTVQCRGK